MSVGPISDNPSSRPLAQIGPERSPIAVSLSEYKGNRFLDIRRYYKKKGSDELLPTRKGISLNASVLESLLNSVSENKEGILSWLESGEDKVKDKVERDLQIQLDAKNEIARKSRRFGINEYEQKDQRFFSCSSEGANDIVSLNVSHPLNDRIHAIVQQFSQSKDLADIEKGLRNLVASLLISYYRAGSLFAADSEMQTDQLLEALEYEWGAILKNYMKE